MALSITYINEVLNQLPFTAVFSEQEWPSLLKALKFEEREASTCVLGQMRLRWHAGGYDGLLARLDQLTAERDALQKQVEELTAPAQTATIAATHAL